VWSVFSGTGENPMSLIQTYIGSAFSSYPVRWIETPEAARSQYALDQTTEKPVAKVADLDIGKPRSESGDVLDISPATQKALELSRSDTKIRLEESDSALEKPEKQAAPSTVALAINGNLTSEEQAQVDELKAKDQEVRTHEMAHVAAGGQHVTGGPSYEYEIGPDGKGYAVGGTVGIDTSPVAGDPEATIAKMQTVVAAALAPSKPSGQDLKVAAAARQAEAKARAELAQAKMEQPKESEQSSGDQSESASVSAAFFIPGGTIVRMADKEAEVLPQSSVTDSVMPSLIQVGPKSGSEFTPGSAYKAQSAALSVPRFSAFT